MKLKLTALKLKSEAIGCRHQESEKTLLMEAWQIKEQAEAELTRLEQFFPRAAIKRYKNLELKKAAENGKREK